MSAEDCRADDDHAFGFLPGRAFFQRVFLVLAVGTWLAANCPLQLQRHDQDRQAFTSLEMIRDGLWWHQHIPAGGVATKPPLAGWISAGIYRLTGTWEAAWTLASLIPGLLLLVLIYREGERWLPGLGGFLAGAGFAVNLFTVRVATSIRTDMLLALWIYLAGWLILHKIRTNTPWTVREQLALAVFGFFAAMTKGPQLYAFVFPGVVAAAVIDRRLGLPCRAWSGWLSWVLPLVAFGAWVAMGIREMPGFFEETVIREFLGRFDGGPAAAHKTQPFWWYVPHLVHKVAPASLAVLALGFCRPVRESVRRDPAIRWLVLWFLGGLLVMSLIPSKRPIRIYPLVLPLVLLVPAWLARLPDAAWQRRGLRATVLALPLAGLILVGAYTVGETVHDFRTGRGELAAFSRAVRSWGGETGLRYEVVSPPDPSVLPYVSRTQRLSLDEAIVCWDQGGLDALVMSQESLDAFQATGRSGRELARTRPSPEVKSVYVLLRRDSPVAPR